MRIEYQGCSQTGAVRSHNEDAVLMRSTDDAALFLVADGIGGGTSGEVVSRMLRDRFGEWWDGNISTGHHKAFLAYLDEIKEMLCRVNRDVVDRYGELKAGSTAALLFLHGGTCAYLWSGDSRIYKIRSWRCGQMTRDDIFENLPEERAARYEGMNTSGRLAGAVGLRTQLDFSVRTDDVRAGDGFFLCSDGVYRYVSPRKLNWRLVADFGIFSQKCVSDRLCADITKNGAGDNYSFILVRVRQI